MESLEQARRAFKPKLPTLLKNPSHIHLKALDTPPVAKEIVPYFPYTGKQPRVTFATDKTAVAKPLRVGVVLSGGQAAGGHNVIAGLLDILEQIHPESRLIGFLDGPKGLIDHRYKELTQEVVAPYRNQGGFDLLGSGRTKIETVEQFSACLKIAQDLKLEGIVIIGGDDSNTTAAHLAEYFAAQKQPTCVVGVPKTIDGDLKSEFIEASFGFDTASKTFAEAIGSVQRDALSAKKYYFFIKLMGRTASHLTLECALKTHPNLALIGEEIAKEKWTLKQVAEQIAHLIVERHEQGKDYGVILIPEGIIEFIPEIKTLISELNQGKQEALSPASAACLAAFPESLKQQFLLDRDPHGNVQVSKIETERLFIEMVKSLTSVPLNAQPLFFGYEGRSCLPSNFDAQYCYALGASAAVLIACGATGYISAVQGLTHPVEEWQVGGVPLASLMTIEKRKGKEQAVVKKALVDLQGAPFKAFEKARKNWAHTDDYHLPGPIQFYGPFADLLTETLQLEHP